MATTTNLGWIYTPEGFDPDQYPGPIAKHPDAARWFLNSIYFKRLLRNYHPEEYVNLHSHLLGLVMGKWQYVKPVREALEKYRLIGCDHHYIQDLKSIGYRLGPALQGATWARYESTNKRFLKRVAAFKEFIHRPSGFTLPVHHHLHRWAERVELPADLPQLLFPTPEKGELALHQTEMIREGLRHYSVCPYGRFHSNFTGLCREVRPFLKIEGEDLVEVDIVNSQPYFLGLSFWKSQ